MLHLEVGERPVSLSDVSRERVDNQRRDVGNRSGSIESNSHERLRCNYLYLKYQFLYFKYFALVPYE